MPTNAALLGDDEWHLRNAGDFSATGMRPCHEMPDAAQKFSAATQENLDETVSIPTTSPWCEPTLRLSALDAPGRQWIYPPASRVFRVVRAFIRLRLTVRSARCQR